MWKVESGKWKVESGISLLEAGRAGDRKATSFSKEERYGFNSCQLSIEVGVRRTIGLQQHGGLSALYPVRNNAPLEFLTGFTPVGEGLEFLTEGNPGEEQKRGEHVHFQPAKKIQRVIERRNREKEVLNPLITRNRIGVSPNRGTLFHIHCQIKHRGQGGHGQC